MTLAKRRLSLYGPRSSGQDAAAIAALVVAAEASRYGATDADARALVRRMPFHPGRDSFARIRRKMEQRLAFAYERAAAGDPILTGCCQDPRPRTGNQTTSKLRETFAPFCDEDCARTCPMLAAIRNPGRQLHGTVYEPLERSALWLHGAKLGHAAHEAWRLLALLALAQDNSDVEASFTFLTMKLDGHYALRTVRRALDALADARLVTLVDPKEGVRRVHALTADQVAELERERGVYGARQRNITEARDKADAYRDWLQDVEEAWTLADDPEDDRLPETWQDEPLALSPLERWEAELSQRPAPDLRPSSFHSVPRFLAPWGGGIKAAYEWDKWDRYRNGSGRKRGRGEPPEGARLAAPHRGF